MNQNSCPHTYDANADTDADISKTRPTGLMRTCYTL